MLSPLARQLVENRRNLSEGVEEHENLKDHTKNPYHNVLTKHGFDHVSTEHKHNKLTNKFNSETGALEPNPQHDYTEHRYAKGEHKVIVTQYHTSAGGRRGAYNAYWRHLFKQSNGIVAPTHGETKPSLDKHLTREHGSPQ